MKRRILPLLAVVAIAASAFTLAAPGGDKYFEIVKNIEIFANLYKELNSGYVDDLDPGRTMRVGIDAMLNALDPYTNYISESDIEGYRTLSEGRYQGIGAQVRQIGEYVTILQTYQDSPASKAGLKAGDRLMEVDGQDARNRSTDDLNQLMQGVPGTRIKLKVERPGTAKPFVLELTRAEVNIPNVPYSGIVGDHVGYIVLTTFTQEAAANISRALGDLKAKDPQLKGLILDLRDNGGGLLNEAVDICNLFLPKGEVVVSTRGKTADGDRVYKTTKSAQDEKLPLVVLINAKSASASEIVSGTIQDLDRGVLMGQLSYGKGLVQHTKEIGYNARLKYTTSKYYIPSGRCIQAVRYKNGEPEHIPDSERARFKTRNGREVLDGGGVKPDIALDAPGQHPLIKALQEQGMLFDYVTRWCLKHESIAGPESFRFTDWDDLTRYLAERKFSYRTASEEALDKLRAEAAKEKLDKSIEQEAAALEQRIAQWRQASLESQRAAIVSLVEEDIIGRYHFEKGRKQLALRNDPEIAEAVKLLNDPVRYAKILKK